MKQIPARVGRAELAYQTLLDAICDGTWPAGTQLVQEELAEKLGVSRQPIQQAMARLKGDGLLVDAPGRGLCVPPLDMQRMRSHYEIRCALDRLAARLAAAGVANGNVDRNAVCQRGNDIVGHGQRAVDQGAVKDMIRHDVEFHSFIYEISGNALINTAAEPHWRFLRRAMGDILRRAKPPPSIWQQHEDILQSILDGETERAESLADQHIWLAADALIEIMGGQSG